MDLIYQLKNKNNFSISEKKIVDYLFSNSEKIQPLSMRELANQTKVSAPTVLRLIRKLGFDNYNDFKLAFVSLLEQQTLTEFDFYNSQIGKEDNTYTVMNKLLLIHHSLIDEINEQLNYEQIQKIAKIIFNSDIIDLYGSGLNYNLNQLIAYYLMRMGKEVVLFDSTEEKIAQAFHSNDRHVAIMVSHSGKKQDSLEVARLLKKNNTFIITLTGFMNSSLALLSDEVIYINPGVNFESMSSMIFRISVNHVFNVLFGAVFARYCEVVGEQFIEYNDLSKFLK